MLSTSNTGREFLGDWPTASIRSMEEWRERFRNRFSYLKRTEGMTQASLAEAIGVTQGTVGHWLRGRRTPENPEQFEALARGLRMSLAELLAGVVPGKEGGGVEEGPDVGEYRRAPVVGTAQLGPEGYWDAVEYPVGHGDGYVDVPTRDPGAYALRVRGDSMAPAIRDGWYVVIEPNSAVVQGEYVVVVTKDGRAMVKELLWERDGQVSLMSVADGYARITLRLDEIEKMHHVAFIAPPSKKRI